MRPARRGTLPFRSSVPYHEERRRRRTFETRLKWPLCVCSGVELSIYTFTRVLERIGPGVQAVRPRRALNGQSETGAAEMAEIQSARTRLELVRSCSYVSGAYVCQFIAPYLAMLVRGGAFLVSTHETARTCRNIFFSYRRENATAVCALVQGSYRLGLESLRVCMRVGCRY